MAKFSLKYGINKFIFHWVFKKPKGMEIKVSLKSKRFLSFDFRVTLLSTLEYLVFIFLLLSADNYKETAIFKIEVWLRQKPSEHILASYEIL